MNIVPLDPVGVEITGVDLESMTDQQYEFIRNAYIEHQLVLIREQNSDWPIHYARLVERVGSSRGITDLGHCTGIVDQFSSQLWSEKPIQPSKWDSNIQFPVQRVTGEVVNGEQPGLFPVGKLHWHSDRLSPYHVNGTALMAHRPADSSTSFIHTPSVYNDLSDDVKELCKKVKCFYRFDPDRLAPDITPQAKFNLKKSHKRLNNNINFAFPLLLQNASKTVTGLYFNYNMHCRLSGTGSYLSDDKLFMFIKQRIHDPKYKYRHWWKKGDVMLFSQDLTLHCREETTNEQLEKRLLFRYSFNT